MGDLLSHMMCKRMAAFAFVAVCAPVLMSRSSCSHESFLGAFWRGGMLRVRVVCGSFMVLPKSNPDRIQVKP